MYYQKSKYNGNCMKGYCIWQTGLTYWTQELCSQAIIHLFCSSSNNRDTIIELHQLILSSL